MTGRALTQQEIRNLLLNQQASRPSRVPIWPTEVDRKLFFDACMAKKKSVTFSDGRKFNIKYDKAKSAVSWGEYEIAFISPADSNKFVPCGWFHIKFLLKGDG